MKNLIIELIKNLLKVFFVFPIKKNRILFSAYSGKNYSCNPKYICEELLKRPYNDLDIIWAFTNPLSISINQKIRKIKFKC